MGVLAASFHSYDRDRSEWSGAGRKDELGDQAAATGLSRTAPGNSVKVQARNVAVYASRL